MTILHARSDPQFADHLRSGLVDANGQPHSVDIAVGYFYLSGFARVADQLASRPGAVRISLGALTSSRWRKSPPATAPGRPLPATMPARTAGRNGHRC